MDVTLNGNDYSADGSASRDMLNGGHRTWFIPCLADFLVEMGNVNTARDDAEDARDLAQSYAAALSGTSSTSLTVGTGGTSLTASTARQWVVGQHVYIARTSAPTTWMAGQVISYNAGTGALNVDVTASNGSGTYSDWTITIGGAQGPSGTINNLLETKKTAAYTLASGDKGKVISASGTFTLALTSAATLGAGWWCYVHNSGSGVITLDPSSTQLIDGVATITINAGACLLVYCTGSAFTSITVARVPLRRLAIFSAAAASAKPASMGESITFGRTFSTGLAGGNAYAIRANSLFVVNSSNSDSNVATSADGETWTLRSMPAAASWRVAADGNALLAVAFGATGVAISTNSITWSAATALPGNASERPAGIGGTWLVPAVGTSVYRSINHGSTWSTETTPAAVINGIFRVNGRFVFFPNTTTGYHSLTGETGSWTSFALPVTPGLAWIDTDGTVLFAVNSAGAQVYRCDTHDSVSAVPGVFLADASATVFTVNGARACFRTSWGTTKTFHDSGDAVRQSSVNVQSLSAATDGTRWVIPYGGGALTLTEATSQTALFD
jgi:hypothetical protein